MTLRTHMFLALTLTALGLAPGAAHVLELPVKLSYPPAFYADVTSTLYAWYGAVGGGIQVAAAMTVASLAWRLRDSSAVGLAAAAAASLAVSLALWGALVFPVNSAWSAATASADPEAFVAAYERLRLRWEYGHVAAFVAWLTGWAGVAALASRRVASGTLAGE